MNRKIKKLLDRFKDNWPDKPFKAKRVVHVGDGDLVIETPRGFKESES